MTLSGSRFSAEKLINFAASILEIAGLDYEKSKVTAEILVEADLLGHTTHGLQFLPAYIKALEDGTMLKTGEPEVLKDSQSVILWNGNYLPGPWLVQKAIDLALSRIAEHPVVTVVIQKSHHIACLAAYLQKVAEKGLMIIVSCSDPINRTVAPFGSTKGVYSPNPLAAGIPTEGKPILIDVSMSATANASIKRSNDENKKLPHPWLLDNAGGLTDDPATFYKDPPSTILPLGGLDLGYKGFALGILIEALTGALGGYGRAEQPSVWTASVFIQVINPAAFGGTDAFIRQTQYLKDECLNASEQVRMPGERALALREEQKEIGIVLYPDVVKGLEDLAEKYSVAF
ncbi:MAG: Ldh family oxidoreductase [Sphingobacteriaceae bacterium]|nr:Ldh family oxidoreductase [Sphingobacteriaceae bacterium]